jgi:uncharacterized protein (TIGR02145 family)
LAFQQQPASVQIGTQRWTSENLKQTTFLNGDKIKLCTTPEQWDSANDNYEPAYAYPGFNINNFNKGLFYNTYALNDERGLGYYGWRMPSLADATILNNFINAAYPGEKAWTLKSTTSWSPANGTDRYGFNAKPLGELNGVNSNIVAFFALSNNNFESNYMLLTSDKNVLIDADIKDGVNVRLIKI